MRLLVSFVLLSVAAAPTFARPRKTEYVFLVTADGVRTQEVFRGADPLLSVGTALAKSGIRDLGAFRNRFSGESPIERREKLMPFFWKKLARDGVVLGNRERGSGFEARNGRLISYPGYAEILNGAPVAEVTTNEPQWSPRPTVLEFVRGRFGVSQKRVAAYASWEVFSHMTMHEEGAIFCDAGPSMRSDAETLALALAHVKAHKPKLFYLALGGTDKWAHRVRYDETLESVRFFDEAVEKLWSLLQSMDTYRGRTTLIVTTDHGRGRTVHDWTRHGASVPGSNEIWLAILGPDTPALGEYKRGPVYYQSNVSATILKLFGLDYRSFNPDADAPIDAAFQEKRAAARDAVTPRPSSP